MNNPINRPLRTSTGPVLDRCWQHRPSTGPVLATNGMFSDMLQEAENNRDNRKCHSGMENLFILIDLLILVLQRLIYENLSVTKHRRG